MVLGVYVNLFGLAFGSKSSTSQVKMKIPPLRVMR